MVGGRRVLPGPISADLPDLVSRIRHRRPHGWRSILGHECGRRQHGDHRGGRTDSGRRAGTKTMATLVLDAAAKYTCTALKYPSGERLAGDLLCQPRQGRSRDRQGADRARRPARRSRRDPVQHARGMDARRLRRHLRRRRRRARLPDELARGVPVRPRPLAGDGDLLRGLPSGRQARRDPRRAAAAGQGHPLRGRERGRADARRAEGARRRRHRRAARRARRSACARTSPSRSSTRRAPPGRRRAAC